MSIPAHCRDFVPTGIAALGPPGHYLRIAPRPGMVFRGVAVSPGVIDPDHRGEIKVILVNNNDHSFLIKQHMRIAQMVLERINDSAEVKIVPKLPATARGTGGFGHTDRVYLNLDSARRGAFCRYIEHHPGPMTSSSSDSSPASQAGPEASPPAREPPPH